MSCHHISLIIRVSKSMNNLSDNKLKNMKCLSYSDSRKIKHTNVSTEIIVIPKLFTRNQERKG